jgi:hypothetical protein
MKDGRESANQNKAVTTQRLARPPNATTAPALLTDGGPRQDNSLPAKMMSKINETWDAADSA